MNPCKKAIFLQRLFSIKGFFPLKVFFHQRLSSGLPSKGDFHRRSSSIKGYLSSNYVSHKYLSSIIGSPPSKNAFNQRLFSIKCPLHSKVIFVQRSFSIEGRLPSKVVFHQRLSSVKGLPPSVWNCVLKTRPAVHILLDFGALLVVLALDFLIVVVAVRTVVK